MKKSESVSFTAIKNSLLNRCDYFYDSIVKEIELCASYGRRHYNYILPIMDSNEEQELIDRLKSEGFVVSQMVSLKNSVDFLEISW